MLLWMQTEHFLLLLQIIFSLPNQLEVFNVKELQEMNKWNIISSVSVSNGAAQYIVSALALLGCNAWRHTTCAVQINSNMSCYKFLLVEAKGKYFP